MIASSLKVSSSERILTTANVVYAETNVANQSWSSEWKFAREKYNFVSSGQTPLSFDSKGCGEKDDAAKTKLSNNARASCFPLARSIVTIIANAILWIRRDDCLRSNASEVLENYNDIIELYIYIYIYIYLCMYVYIYAACIHERISSPDAS